MCFPVEGKKAVFKVMVIGAPPPAVVWTRVKCPVLDPEVYKTRYDPRGKEHILEVRGTEEACSLGAACGSELAGDWKVTSSIPGSTSLCRGAPELFNLTAPGELAGTLDG